MRAEGTGTAYGGAGLHSPRPGVAEEQVSVPLAQVLRSSAACDALLKSTPFPSTSRSSRKDGFRSGSQSGCVIYRRIIYLDVNNLGVCWQRVGDQLPRLLCHCTFAAWGDPVGSRGVFLGRIPSSLYPCPSRGTPAPAWTPCRGVPSMLAVPHHP